MASPILSDEKETVWAMAGPLGALGEWPEGYEAP